MMRLGKTEIGVTELVAVAEHTHGLAKVVGSLLIEPDLDRLLDPACASLIGLPVDHELEPQAIVIFEEIVAAEQRETGAERVPNLWRVIGHNHRYLEATWRKHQIVMAEGELSVRQKRIIALSIAMTTGCRYLIERLARTLTRDGFTNADLLEVAALVDHANCLNKITDSMQVESDIWPPGVGPGSSG